MIEQAPTVFVVDDDPSVRKGLARLLGSEGYKVQAFESASAFMAQHDPSAPGCLLLDLLMPGVSGMELQHALGEQASVLPIIFLTGQGDIPTSVRAMKDGAVDFLTKPADTSELLAAVAQALDRNAAMRKQQHERTAVEELLALLTPREREVLGCLAAGWRNKQIAAVLGTVEKTIKVHRARVLEKMQARSLAELIQRVARVGIELARPTDPDGPAHAASHGSTARGNHSSPIA